VHQTSDDSKFAYDRSLTTNKPDMFQVYIDHRSKRLCVGGQTSRSREWPMLTNPVCLSDFTCTFWKNYQGMWLYNVQVIGFSKSFSYKNIPTNFLGCTRSNRGLVSFDNSLDRFEGGQYPRSDVGHKVHNSFQSSHYLQLNFRRYWWNADCSAYVTKPMEANELMKCGLTQY